MAATATDGFSLIETLVAMSVLAVSSSVILSATEAHTRSVTAVTERTLARWVAQNAITEIELGGILTPSVQLGGTSWIVRLERAATTDPDLGRADVIVTTASDPGVVLARLTGFIDLEKGAGQ
ncbi:type II secretion system minor pseudopilin GspI [Tateyamaria sp. syn59]|uniref:type II secretion system minor pseudopilin GspI n=1 Tax=Tateyamaria sp. syn59 TaxID=2576942 RepID=UPI001CB94667|nr:type II secretion system minor pseudopilin GspI [Tateyamaria sp. syn59]